MNIFALVVSGICWFCVAALLGRAVPILGEMWLQHLISAVLTSFAVSFLFKKPLMTWWGGWRYILPILTLFTAATLFGFLVPLSWWVTARIKGNGNIESEAFYLVPAVFVLYSMTVYFLILYPLALLTQTLLYKFSHDAESAEQTFGAGSP